MKKLQRAFHVKEQMKSSPQSAALGLDLIQKGSSKKGNFRSLWACSKKVAGIACNYVARVSSTCVCIYLAKLRTLLGVERLTDFPRHFLFCFFSSFPSNVSLQIKFPWEFRKMMKWNTHCLFSPQYVLYMPGRYISIIALPPLPFFHVKKKIIIYQVMDFC